MSNKSTALKNDQADSSDIHHIVEQVASLVSKLSGIQLGPKQFSMIENRLRSRMIRLGINNPDEYLMFLNQNWNEESQNLLSLITTHHTYFFREFAHFEFMQNVGLKNVIENVRKREDKTIRIWSAACSRGQEAYSIAMLLELLLPKLAPDLKYEIYGTDVDAESVKIAKNGVYPYKEIKEIPIIYTNNHWVRGKDEIANFVKAKTSIKNKCKFDVYNLNQPSLLFKDKKFDYIFCRNVFIYFSNEQIKQVSKHLISHLANVGYFFIGISESLNNMNLPLKQVGPSIYAPVAQVINDIQAKTVIPSNTSNDNVTDNQLIHKTLRILCVDDSPSILTLLKKLLDKENGFEVIGTAANGEEAAQFLRNNEVDLVTLDIHMPVMDGISYLQKYMNTQHPPVVMISSVNRENVETAFHSLELGAVDYIEKPSLQTLMDRADEIRNKLKTAFMYRNTNHGPSMIDQSFKKKFTIAQPEQKARLIFASLSHKKQLEKIILQIHPDDPPTILLFEGANETLSTLAKQYSQQTEKNVQAHPISLNIEKGSIYLCDAKNDSEIINSILKSKKVCGIALGLPTPYVRNYIMDHQQVHWILEDLGSNNNPLYNNLKKVVAQVAPFTSYLSISEEYLGEK